MTQKEEQEMLEMVLKDWELTVSYFSSIGVELIKRTKGMIILEQVVIKSMVVLLVRTNFSSLSFEKQKGIVASLCRSTEDHILKVLTEVVAIEDPSKRELIEKLRSTL
jgi:hypothetical protein